MHASRIRSSLPACLPDCASPSRDAEILVFAEKPRIRFSATLAVLRRRSCESNIEYSLADVLWFLGWERAMSGSVLG